MEFLTNYLLKTVQCSSSQTVVS